MSDSSASSLRARARRLRILADRIERTPAMSLERLAGPDTWRGRRPLLCVNLLRTNQAQLHSAVEDLRWTAHLFDLRADDIDRLLARDEELAG